MNFRELQSRILLSACLILPYATSQSTDQRCKNVISVPNHKACELFGRITGENDANDAIPCSDERLDKQQCSHKECCWFKGGCYRKPAKCYADFRLERCPLRRAWTASSIYTGYSINGSNCFIESIQTYFDGVSKRFGSATSSHGIRIVGPGQRNDSCVKWVNTNVTVITGAPKNCTVESWIGNDRELSSRQNGTVRAQKCVLRIGRYFTPFDIGSPKTCGCHLDSWAESKSESTQISNAIREYAEKEEAKSGCSKILGKLVRKSWRDRVEIVNSAEVEVVVDALLNITNKKVVTKDAEVLLDTSKQLSKYKFYEGLENDSANLLIQSSTKFLSKIMKSVNSQRPPTAPHISKRSSEPEALMDSPDSGTTFQASDDLQWKIMENLEGIAENIASLIDLPQDEFRYVVEAKEEAVSLQVAIAKPKNVNHLKNVTGLDQKENSTEIGHARVTDFSSYQEEDNVAIITVFYEVPGKELDGSQRRASGILAINPRTMKNEIVSGRLSLPVTFTLPASNNSCNGTSCKSVCAYAVKSSSVFGRESWDDTGCEVVHTDEDFTTCSCNHTTHFAVLMQPFTESVWSEEDVRVLEILSIVLGTVSLAALSATLLVFIIYRRILLKDRMLIHLHLIIALMGGYISLLCGAVFSSEYLDVQEACFGFAIASHLFFLSAFFWFLMEGVYLFYKVVMVFSNKWVERVTKYSPFFGWGAPILIVIVAVAVSRYLTDTDGPGEYDPYFNAERCFLQTENGMIWAFMAPALAIISINICVLIKVVIVIYQSSISRNSKSSDHGKVSDSLKNSAKGAVLLMPILGVPWILNVFALLGGPGGTVIAYLHVTLMGMQGVCIFMFYCFFNSEVRAAYKLSAARRRSLASLEPTTKNSRKRSRAPLITSKEDSLDAIRYKNSLTPSSIGKVPSGSSQISTSSAPPSPDSRKNSLPIVQEQRL